jgi:kynurenine aminotransferase
MAIRSLNGTSTVNGGPAVNGTKAHSASKMEDRSQLIPFSSRLKEGRALAQDVWSIFK